MEHQTRSAITLRAVSWDDPDGLRLRNAQRAEIDHRYGNDSHEPGGAPSGAEIDMFLIAYDDAGVARGCGALRQLDATSAEVKRMYVEPSARGTGISTAILKGLEAHARTRGWQTLRLETGSLLPEAMRFYAREGYHPIPNYGVYAGVEDSRCFEKDLLDTSY